MRPHTVHYIACLSLVSICYVAPYYLMQRFSLIRSISLSRLAEWCRKMRVRKLKAMFRKRKNRCNSGTNSTTFLAAADINPWWIEERVKCRGCMISPLDRACLRIRSVRFVHWGRRVNNCQPVVRLTRKVDKALSDCSFHTIKLLPLFFLVIRLFFLSCPCTDLIRLEEERIPEFRVHRYTWLIAIGLLFCGRLRNSYAELMLD